jgi:hypothetical protein
MTLVDKLATDIQTLKAIREKRYLSLRDPVAKSGNIHLAWVFYAGDPKNHDRFINMLRVSPYVLGPILNLIKDHKVFTNNSNMPQTPVLSVYMGFRLLIIDTTISFERIRPKNEVK